MKTKRNTENDIKYLFRTTFKNGTTVYNTTWNNDPRTVINNIKGWDKKDDELGIKTNTRKQVIEWLADGGYKIELLEKTCEKEIEIWGQEYIDNDPNTISTRVGKWHPVVVKPVVVKKYNREGDILVKTVTTENGTVYYIDRRYGKVLGLEKYMVECSTYGNYTNYCEVKKELKIL